MWSFIPNGLPQGSLLPNTLFNRYTNNQPVAKCRRFTLADNICCVVQAKSFRGVERNLTSDMAKIAEYCRRWRLKPSVPKTVLSVFHLHNKSHDRELNVSLNGQWLTHDSHPVYLGVTLDRTLSNKHHLTKTAAKPRSRNNLLSKLAVSRGVLLSSMVQVITYRSSRRAAQQHHAPHHRNTAPYTVVVAASSRQYCTC